MYKICLGITFLPCLSLEYLHIEQGECVSKHSMTLTVFFLLLLPVAFAADGKKPKPSAKPQVLSDHDRALHALERLTFGPRPGDIEKVLSLGLDNWIEQQLNPGKIPNGTLDGRLGAYRTLRMQPRELGLAF